MNGVDRTVRIPSLARRFELLAVEAELVMTRPLTMSNMMERPEVPVVVLLLTQHPVVQELQDHLLKFQPMDMDQETVVGRVQA